MIHLRCVVSTGLELALLQIYVWVVLTVSITHNIVWTKFCCLIKLCLLHWLCALLLSIWTLSNLSSLPSIACSYVSCQLLSSHYVTRNYLTSHGLASHHIWFLFKCSHSLTQWLVLASTRPLLWGSSCDGGTLCVDDWFAICVTPWSLWLLLGVLCN